jgi:hypothetical protein
LFELLSAGHQQQTEEPCSDESQKQESAPDPFEIFEGKPAFAGSKSRPRPSGRAKTSLSKSTDLFWNRIQLNQHQLAVLFAGALLLAAGRHTRAKRAANRLVACARLKEQTAQD